MHKIILIIIVAIALAACGGKGASTAVSNSASPNAKRYPIQGKVVSIDAAAKKATIEHKDIPGFMEGMTMEFPIHADWAWDEIKPGA